MQSNRNIAIYNVFEGWITTSFSEWLPICWPFPLVTKFIFADCVNFESQNGKSINFDAKWKKCICENPKTPNNNIGV